MLRIVESWDGWLVAVWERRGGMGKKKKEKQRKRVSAGGWVYNGFFWWNHRRLHSVGDSIGDSVGDSVTSLYGYLSLNSLGHSVGKIVWRHHVVAYFQTNCIPRRRNGRYILTEPTDLGRRYIPIDFETELFPSVIVTDRKILSVILLIFSGFLVVWYQTEILFSTHATCLWRRHRDKTNTISKQPFWPLESAAHVVRRQQNSWYVFNTHQQFFIIILKDQTAAVPNTITKKKQFAHGLK